MTSLLGKGNNRYKSLQQEEHIACSKKGQKASMTEMERSRRRLAREAAGGKAGRSQIKQDHKIIWSLSKVVS